MGACLLPCFAHQVARLRGARCLAVGKSIADYRWFFSQLLSGLLCPHLGCLFVQHLETFLYIFNDFWAVFCPPRFFSSQSLCPQTLAFISLRLKLSLKLGPFHFPALEYGFRLRFCCFIHSVIFLCCRVGPSDRFGSRRRFSPPLAHLKLRVQLQAQA